MLSDYYSVPINEQLLEDAGFRKNKQGRYERYVFRDDEFFDVLPKCPKCGRPVFEYSEMIISNGTMQIRSICSTEYCMNNVRQKYMAKQFAKEVREVKHE